MGQRLLFDSRDFDLSSFEEGVLDNASYYGRIFARCGGLADAMKEGLKEVFEKSVVQTGEVRIYTVLNYVSSSGMTRYISAFVPVIKYEGADSKNPFSFVHRQRPVR